MNDENRPNLTLLSSDAEDVTPETPVICEMRSFTDNEGRTVMGAYPLDNPDHPTFTGVFTVASNVGPLRMQMEFPEGTTVLECFAQFDGFAQETIQKAQEEASDRSRIVTPDMLRKGQGQGIVTP